MYSQAKDFFTERDRFAAHTGIKLEEVSPGYARVSMAVEDYHLNGMNMVHGGAIFTLADFAFAAAANAAGQATVSISASISFMKSSRGKILTAEAREVSASRRVVYYQMDVFDEEKVLLARMNGVGFRKDQLLPFAAETVV